MLLYICLAWIIAWIYKEPKVSVLQANAKLVQKVLGLEWGIQYSLGITFCYWNCIVFPGKASDANVAIITNVVCV